MKNDFLIELFDLLNKHYDYAVLRNYENLPAGDSGRDIDILLTKFDLKQLKKQLVNLAEKHDCRILYTTEDNQFFTIVLGDSDDNIFQLDFQYNFAWLGIDLLDEKEILKKRIFNGKVYHFDPALTFLPKYLYCRLLGAKYPEKYASVRQAALDFDKQYIFDTLEKLSGKSGELSYWDNVSKHRIRLRCFFSALKQRPLRAIGRMSSFIFHYLMDLFCRRGLMISFSGPDGCGKSTVIEAIRAKLEVNPPLLFHFRPTLLPNLGEAVHSAGLKKTVDRNFDVPHRGKKQGLASSIIRLGYYSSDYILGYLFKILPLRQRKHIVFFDRYFTDIIADGERSSIFLNFKFIFFLRYFIPQCRYNFIFIVEPENILKRKRELSAEAIERIYLRLNYVADHDKRFFRIDNNSTPDAAVRQIFKVIKDHQHSIYAKKLSR